MSIFKNSLQGLRIVFSDLTSYRTAFFASLGLGYLYYWLYNQVSTIEDFINMTIALDFGQYSYAYAAAYVSTTLLTIVLFGISVASIVWLFKHSKLTKLASGSNVVGVLVGAFASACPICGAFLLSIIGVTGGLSVFPMMGLELKAISLVLIGWAAIYSLSKVFEYYTCEECADITKVRRTGKIRFADLLVPLLIVVFILNHTALNTIGTKLGLLPKSNVVFAIFKPKSEPSYTVIATRLNPDSKTTSLVELPTISEVPANPGTGDHLEDAKVVMLPTGTPEYAPEGISFDDPVGSLKNWQNYLKMDLNEKQAERWKTMTNTFTCSYCCGTATNVTLISECDCAHSRAWKGFFRYMIATYDTKYSDDQLLGEGFRWTGAWYPRGVLEEYLLATNNTEVLPHKSHGGAGQDGMHGFTGDIKSSKN